VIILGQTNTAQYTRAFWQSTHTTAAGATFVSPGSGARLTAQDTDAVRFLFESGDITSGGYAVYGLI